MLVNPKPQASQSCDSSAPIPTTMRRIGSTTGKIDLCTIHLPHLRTIEGRRDGQQQLTGEPSAHRASPREREEMGEVVVRCLGRCSLCVRSPRGIAAEVHHAVSEPQPSRAACRTERRTARMLRAGRSEIPQQACQGGGVTMVLCCPQPGPPLPVPSLPLCQPC